MEHHREDPLLEHRRVQTRFPIPHGQLVRQAMVVLGLPIARNGAGKFPTQSADDVGIRIVFNGGRERLQADFCYGIGRRREIFAESFPTLRIRDQFPGQSRIVSRKQIHDRGIDGKKTSLRTEVVENFGVKSRTGTVHRVAARHPKRHRLVAGNLIQQINAVVIGRGGRRKIALGQEWTRMFGGMDFQRQTFFQPGLDLLVAARHRFGHYRNRGAAINPLEPVQNWPQKRFVLGALGHVVNGQNDNCFNARFTDPLWRCQFRKLNPGIERIVAIKIR